MPQYYSTLRFPHFFTGKDENCAVMKRMSCKVGLLKIKEM